MYVKTFFSLKWWSFETNSWHCVDYFSLHISLQVGLCGVVCCSYCLAWSVVLCVSPSPFLPLLSSLLSPSVVLSSSLPPVISTAPGGKQLSVSISGDLLLHSVCSLSFLLFFRFSLEPLVLFQSHYNCILTLRRFLKCISLTLHHILIGSSCWWLTCKSSHLIIGGSPIKILFNQNIFKVVIYWQFNTQHCLIYIVTLKLILFWWVKMIRSRFFLALTAQLFPLIASTDFLKLWPELFNIY